MATRRERVVLDLQDNFTPGMMKAAAATRMLNAELNRLSGASVQTSRGTAVMERDLDKVSTSANRADTSINQLTGRLRLFADIAAILGPSLAPVGGVLVAGMAGLANQIGVAALAGGTAIIAFQGVGDALKAVNEAALEPTTANLEKARDAMEKLDPAARKFVRQIQQMRPAFAALRDSAAGGLFPGMVESLDTIEARFPEFQRILRATGETLGDLLASGAEGLAGDEFDQFFDFLETDAQDSLADLGAIVGNLTRGLAEMWMAFDPVNDDFSGWLRRVSEDFVSWSDGLSQTQGFNEFIDYIRENGPQVAATFSSLGDAVLQIIEASAPLGGPVLASLEAVADVISAIADSDLGTPIMAGVAALALYNRTLQMTAALQTRAAAGGGALGFIGVNKGTGSLKTLREDLMVTTGAMAGFGRGTDRAAASAARLANVGKAAGVVAGIGVAATGAADKIGLTNTMSLGLLGTMGGPWGAAIGGAIGLTMDLAGANDSAADAIANANSVMANTTDITARTDALAEAKAAMDDFEAKLSGPTDKKFWLGSPMDALSSVKNYTEGLFGMSDLEEQQRDYDVALKKYLDGRQMEIEAANAAGDAIGRLTEMRRADAAAALESENAELAYNAAQLASKEAAKEYGDVLKGVKDARGAETSDQQAAYGALLNEAAAWNNLGDAAQEMPGRYRNVRKSLIDTAVDMGMTRKAARDLADEILDIPKTANTKAKFDDKAARSAIDALKQKLNDLDGSSATVQLITQLITKGTPAPAAPNNLGDILTNGLPKKASGGLITGPGTSTSDSIPALLSNREFVINAAAVEEYGVGLFEMLNARKLAAGGPAGAGIGSALSLSRTANGQASDLLTAMTTALGFGEGLQYVGMSLRDLEREIKRSEKALDAETSKRDELQSAMDSIASSFGRFETQIFGREQSANVGSKPEGMSDEVWAQVQSFHQQAAGKNGLANSMASLQGDIALGQGLEAAIKRLEKKGFDGVALQALLEQGSADEIRSYAAMSRNELRGLESLYEQRAAVFSSAGTAGGEAAWGKELRATNAGIRELVAEQKAGNKVLDARLKAVEKAAAVTGPKNFAEELKSSTGDSQRRGGAA